MNRFDQILKRLQDAEVTPQAGINSSHVLILKRDLSELLRDWERLDRKVREIHHDGDDQAGS